MILYNKDKLKNYKMISNIKLRPKQDEAFDLMVSGKNVFITGPGGSGKSEAIKLFTNLYSEIKKIAITSTTGTSALLIGGSTLHSYLGIGLGKGSIDAISSLIFKRSYLRKRWCEIDVLVIDEISMLSPELFDKIENIARIVRHNRFPFGGIQLILSGDFCQLPCPNSDEFCFRAKSWDSCIKHVVYLNEIIRQTDIQFQKCLNSIRIGNLDAEVIDLLNSRIGVKLENNLGVKPTKLFSLNHLVDQVNNQEIQKLAKNNPQFYEYEAEITIYNKKNRDEILEKYNKYCIAPQVLQLCEGVQVMLLCNLDLNAKLANGSRGIVSGFIDDLPVVKFLTGEERLIDYHTWEIEENDVKNMQIIQIPLKPAYAISINKSQGCSLDYVEVDLRDVFEYGQSYVALSRVKNLEGLSIIGLDFDRIKAHPDAVEYYEKINST